MTKHIINFTFTFFFIQVFASCFMPLRGPNKIHITSYVFIKYALHNTWSVLNIEMCVRTAWRTVSSDKK